MKVNKDLHKLIINDFIELLSQERYLQQEALSLCGYFATKENIDRNSIAIIKLSKIIARYDCFIKNLTDGLGGL